MRDEIYLQGRPSWDATGMSMAYVWAKRSHDAQTQVGAFITNKYHEPISGGYNGWPKDCDDSVLPNLRPDKYQWMIHAEENAIYNSRGSLQNSIIYCTHHPCTRCLLACWQVGIREIVYEHYSVGCMSNIEERKKFFELFHQISRNKLLIRKIDFSR